MIDFIKRQRAGFYIGVCALILVIIGTIVQAVNVNSVGYFQGKTIPGIGVLSALSIIFLIVGVCLRELRVRFPGLVGNIMDFVGLLFLAVVPILLSIAFMNFIHTRAEGLAFILASDDNTRANAAFPGSITIENLTTQSIKLCLYVHAETALTEPEPPLDDIAFKFRTTTGA